MLKKDWKENAEGNGIVVEVHVAILESVGSNSFGMAG